MAAGQAGHGARGLDDDIGVHRGDRLGIARVDRAGRAEGERRLARQLVQVARDDLGRAVMAQHGDRERADGAGADDQHAASRHVARPVHAVPGDGGRLGERRRAQVESVGQRAEHARGQGDAARRTRPACAAACRGAEVGAGRGEVRVIGGERR